MCKKSCCESAPEIIIWPTSPLDLSNTLLFYSAEHCCRPIYAEIASLAVGRGLVWIWIHYRTNHGRLFCAASSLPVVRPTPFHALLICSLFESESTHFPSVEDLTQSHVFQLICFHWCLLKIRICESKCILCFSTWLRLVLIFFLWKILGKKNPVQAVFTKKFMVYFTNNYKEATHWKDWSPIFCKTVKCG